MPIDDCKAAIGFQCGSHSFRQSSALRNTMKRVCQENKVRWCSQFSNAVSVARYEIAIRYPVFGQPMACDLKQIRININRAYVSCDLANLQGETDGTRPSG